MKLFPSPSSKVDPRSAFPRERGATAVEYGLLVALIAAAVIATVALLGPIVYGLYESVQW